MQVFKEVVKDLKTQAPFLTRKGNPLYSKKNLNRLSPVELKALILDYSIFSRNAIHYLLQARIVLDTWKHTSKEISRNIAEELNDLGIPHLEIMHKGYMTELGIYSGLEDINLDAEINSNLHNHLIPYRNTLTKRLDELFYGSVAELAMAGRVMALEYIAYEEFHVIKSIISVYKKKKGLKNTPMTDRYLDIHINVEKNHFEHLRDSIFKDCVKLKKYEHDIIMEGFRSTSYVVNDWWKSWTLFLLRGIV